MGAAGAPPCRLEADPAPRPTRPRPHRLGLSIDEDLEEGAGAEELPELEENAVDEGSRMEEVD